MTKYCFIILSIVWLSIAWLSMTQSHAKVYRWVDNNGQVHYTDNPGRIPADRLDRSRERSPETLSGQVPRSETPTVSVSATTVATPTDTSDQYLTLRQQETEISARIAMAQAERQHYFEQLKSIRPSRMNPAFGGRDRRLVVELGRSLVDVERRLDTLHDALQQIQGKLQPFEQIPQPTTAAAAQAADRFFDQQGHTRAYWRRRSAPLHDRIQQARAHRQAILQQLSSESQTAVGRHGKEVLRLTRALEQVNQDLDRATTDLQHLQQEAARAGAPASWLQRNAP